MSGVGPRIDVLSLFPDWFDGPLRASLLGRAVGDGTLDVRVHDLRDWTTDRHRTVDDTPYGGGAGMVMRADVIVDAAEAVWNDPPPSAPWRAGGDRPHTVVLTPRGRPFTQQIAHELAAMDRFVLICGRYEGIDERAHELVATDEISIGDYVLFGGEVAAAVVIEAVTRLVPGVVGNDESPYDESFADGLLEYPHYTRPADVRGLGVPEVLTSGDHGAVDRWRREQALELTRRRRPDLLDP
ncbi:MAG: tRNA (guanosine(37)-N1)-methyltransferase TrmD [Nitriliruptoraceae bacterium]